MEQEVLGLCGSSHMFWFDKENPNVVFGDVRNEKHQLCDGRSLVINPDAVMDFRDMPFADKSFSLVIFEPPYLVHDGKQCGLKLKYGKLSTDWKDDIRKGFNECFRVLKPNGVLIFKWNETQVKVREILNLTEHQPLFGHISGKRANTHWIAFMNNSMTIKQGKFMNKVDELIKDFNYLIGKLDIGNSFLDARAIDFLTNFSFRVLELKDESNFKEDWQPIESAPEEGSYLVFGGVLHSELGEPVANVIAKVEGKSYSGENCYTVADGCYYETWVDSPTYWMPLPTAPNIK